VNKFSSFIRIKNY